MTEFLDHEYWRERKGLSVSMAGDALAPGGFVTEVLDYRPGRAPQADTRSLQATLTRNELVYACVAVKATAARDPRLLVQRSVQRGGKTVWEELPGHPFRQLIMRPNMKMTEGDLMRAAIVSWDISNPRRFYAEKERDGRGLLIALHPLNPAGMRPIASRTPPHDTIGYAWSDGAARREYALDELLIRSAPSWYDPAPAIAALGSTESDTAQTDYIRAFFENGGVPPGLLKYSMPLNDPQREDIREKWRSRYGNRFGRSHDIGILDANVEYQATGSKLDELASQTLRGVAESRICMVFGVPPLIVYAYVGLLRATYSNLKEAWAGFWDATMSPAFKEWRDFWTWHLLTEYEDERAIRGERVRLAYDMATVAALVDDVDQLQTRARANYQIGGISLNEFRSAIGYDAVAGGDTPAGAGAIVPAKGREGTRRGEKKKPSGQLIERRMEQAMTSYLATQYQAAAAAVRAAT